MKLVKYIQIEMWGLIASICLLTLSAQTNATTLTNKIQIQNGEVVGVVLGSGVSSYKGIPYAKAPVGNLRFRKATAPSPWTEPLVADRYGNICPQKGSPADSSGAPRGSEDCLYLNVWVPENPSGKKLPVMVWIHGGIYVSGSSDGSLSDGGKALYDGEKLAKDHDVIIVAINYRLGLLGFFAHDALAARTGTFGNLGLWDQNFALKWVQQNIAKFGGNPSQVTLFGESAGANSILAHMASEHSRPLFQRAIVQSSPNSFERSKTNAQRISTYYANKIGCAGDSQAMIDCLMKKPTKDLLEIDSFLPQELRTYQTVGELTLQPTIEGDFLKQDIRQALRNSPKKIPTIIGYNSREVPVTAYGTTGAEVFGISELTDDEFKTLLVSDYGPRLAKTVYENYKTHADFDENFADYSSDYIIRCGVRQISDQLQLAGNRVYKYRFDKVLAEGIAAVAGVLCQYIDDPACENEVLGDIPSQVAHAFEIPYVFQQMNNEQLPLESKVSQSVGRYWTRFAKSSNPNSLDVARWPQYEANSDKRLLIDVKPTVDTIYKDDRCDGFDKAFPIK